MEKVPYTNSKNHAVHVGSVMVMPGSTRMVDPRDVPGFKGQAAAEPEAQEPQRSLVDGTIAEIEAALPGLSDEDLQALQAAEQAGKTRKGVLSAIAEELIRRAGGGEPSIKA